MPRPFRRGFRGSIAKTATEQSRSICRRRHADTSCPILCRVPPRRRPRRIRPCIGSTRSRCTRPAMVMDCRCCLSPCHACFVTRPRRVGQQRGRQQGKERKRTTEVMVLVHRKSCVGEWSVRKNRRGGKRDEWTPARCGAGQQNVGRRQVTESGAYPDSAEAVQLQPIDLAQDGGLRASQDLSRGIPRTFASTFENVVPTPSRVRIGRGLGRAAASRERAARLLRWRRRCLGSSFR